MSTKIEARFVISPFFESQEEDYNTRQISVLVNDSRVAVINCYRQQGDWLEPTFLILNGSLSCQEMSGLGFAMTRAQELMRVISNPNIKMSELELIIEKSDGITSGSSLSTPNKS